jgi:hypothetical protein
LLRHRIAARRRAILDRRASETSSNAPRQASPSNVALLNGNGNGSIGFTAVNTAHTEPLNLTGASEDIKMDLLRQFNNVKLLKKMGEGYGSPSGLSSPAIGSSMAQNSDYGVAPAPFKGSGSVTHTPQAAAPKDDGPYKAEIMARMDLIPRGKPMVPPCDRCRRLHMDCMKNLTACLGCTKKHAKCAWKEVRPEELASLGPLPSKDDVEGASAVSNGTGSEGHARSISGSGSGLDTAVASLAAVAQAVVDTTDGQAPVARSLGLFDTSSGHNPAQVQSPNIVHHHQPQTPHHQHTNTSSHHQSPNLPPFAAFSPPQPPHGTPNIHSGMSANTTSVNMQFAPVMGRRMTTPPPTDDSMMDMSPAGPGPESPSGKDTESNTGNENKSSEQVMA